MGTHRPKGERCTARARELNTEHQAAGYAGTFAPTMFELDRRVSMAAASRRRDDQALDTPAPISVDWPLFSYLTMPKGSGTTC